MFYEGCTLDEIKAYRELESAKFDFGEGPMKIEGIYGSEDAYYEMCIEDRKERVYKDPKDNTERLCGKKERIKKYQKRLEGKEKELRGMVKLREKNWWAVSDMGTHLKRNYMSGRASFLKKEANKKVRKHMKTIDKGNQYRKIYELEYNLF